MQYPTQKTVTAFHDKTQLVRQKRKIVLRVRVPEKPDRLVELVRTRVSLGRSRNNHVVIEHDSVSAAHAELQQIDQRIEFVDLDSRNGSWVNNRWVSRAEVVVGDELRLGDARIDLLSFDEVDIPLSSEHRLGDLWGGSDVMRELFVELASFAAADINLLIQGETGTGKELAARAVHAFSPRADGPFVVVDCGQLVPALASSALFGHARGAFTGADRATPGAFEVAHGGTIFLDELGELPPDLQVSLLRALDRGEVTRLGEQTPRKVDVRVVAATHRNLSTLISEGAFREDLYFRIVEGDVEMPPLRRRRGDVRFLTIHFLRTESGETPLEITPGALRILERHAWPGNVRELRNVLRRAVVVARAQQRACIVESDIRLLNVRRSTSGDFDGLLRLGSYAEMIDALDRVVLPRTLEEHGGVIAHAARALGINRRRYRERMIELGMLPASAAKKEEDSE